MLEDYEEFISLTLRRRSSKEITKNAGKKLETPVAPAMPCKICKKKKKGETRSKIDDFLSKFACILEASESGECVWKNLYRNIMRTTLQENETNHCNITIWYTNLFLCLKQWRYPQQKQQWIKDGRNLERFPRRNWQKSETHQRRSMKQGWRAQKFISPHWWTSVIWRMPNWRQSTKNTKVELYSVVILWNMILDLTQYSLNKDHQHLKWQPPKHGYHIQIARLRWTSSRRSICLFPGQNGRCSKNIEKIPNRNVQTFGFVYHDTNGLNHGPVWKTQSFLLNEICMVILWQDCYVKGNLRKSFWSTVGRRFPSWECLSAHREKGLFLSVYVDDIKIGWKETKY